MTLDEIKQKYFYLTASGTSEPARESFEKSKVTPLIDGITYNLALSAALDTIGTNSNPDDNAGDFLYVSGMELALGLYELDGYSRGAAEGPFSIQDALFDKAQAGVDVRVMGFLPYALVTAPGKWLQEWRTPTIESVEFLRSISSIGQKAVYSIIGHTTGSVHPKIVIIGKRRPGTSGGLTGFGFTGGIDFSYRRRSPRLHQALEWHDIAAQVEGPGMLSVYNQFRLMWNENRARPPIEFCFEVNGQAKFLKSHDSAIAEVPEVSSTDGPSNLHDNGQFVQTLRTIPAFKFWRTQCTFGGRAATAAPEGFFEHESALLKVIAAAETYIYIEDQYFWSKEVLSAINSAVKNKSSLQVILVSGTPDPEDARKEVPVYAAHRKAVNDWLVKDLDRNHLDRIRLFYRLFSMRQDSNPAFYPPASVTSIERAGDILRITTTDTSARPANYLSAIFSVVIEVSRPAEESAFFELIGNDAVSGNGTDRLVLHARIPSDYTGDYAGGMPLPFQWFTASDASGVIVHSKTAIVDDRWALIGSANCTMKSLYTDWEHGIAFTDMNPSDLPDVGAVKAYRTTLWNETFGNLNSNGSAEDPSIFSDPLDLSVWDSSLKRLRKSGQVTSSENKRPSRLVRAHLPYGNLPTFDTRRFNCVIEVNSKEEWSCFK